MKYLEAKNLCDIILKDEIRKHNLDIKGYSFGRIGYYNSDYFKNEIKKIASKKTELTFGSTYRLFVLPFTNKGYFAYNDGILVVFLNDIVDINFSHDAIDILRTVYHEIYHAIDNRNIKAGYYDLSYNVFASSVDRFLRNHYVSYLLKYKFTKKGHDTCMFEILADVYALKKTEEFINSNPNSYKYNISKLEAYKRNCYNNYFAYDLPKRLDFIIKNYGDIKKCSDFDDSIFKFFLDENGHFRNINKLNFDERIKTLDCKIVNAFMSTNAFKQDSYSRNNGELQNRIEERSHK